MYSLARKTLYLTFGFVFLAATLYPQTASAASATLSLSPGSSSVAQGSTLTVTIRMNSDEPVNAVLANLSYPANLLDFVSIGSTAAFPVTAENSGGSGSVQVGRGAFSPVSGSQSVATVRFRAKTNAGTAAITFAGGSSVVSSSSNSNIMTGSSGGNYTLKAPAVAAAIVEAPKDTIAPTLKDVKVSELTYNTAVITWTTSEPSTSVVEYGPTNAYGLTANDPAMVTEHKVILSSAAITPATKYHYVVKSADPAGNAVSSQDGNFTTKGAGLDVTVLNQDKKPVSGAKVTLADKSATTNKNGKAQLRDLPVGKVYGLVEHKGKKTVISADVATIDPKAKTQQATFNIDAKALNPLVVIIPAVLLAVLVWLGLRRNWFASVAGRLKGMMPARNQASTTAPVLPKTIPEPPTIRPTESGNEKNKLP